VKQNINRSQSILMIAVEYPPCRSAGTQRTLKFSEALPDLGWDPVVLTASPVAYTELEESSPESAVPVHRAFALDSLRHFRIGGKYFSFSAFPDRFVSWYLPAVIKGMWLIWRYKPRVIFSSFPYYTAHWVGLTLSKITGLPWVADYRDPAHHHYMFESDGAGENLKQQYSNSLARWVDRRTVSSAERLIFTTEKAQQCYTSAYPDFIKGQCRVIQNGFNDEQFSSLQLVQRNDADFVLLHSGAVSMGRDPHCLIKALAELRQENPDDSPIQSVRIHFRGNVDSTKFTDFLDSLEMTEAVKFLPPVSYAESIKEMMSADALLLLQGEVFKYQIPGKAYEYIASHKPILTLAGENSATSELMASVDASFVAPLSDVAALKKALLSLVAVDNVDRNIATYGRRSRAQQLAKTLDELV